METIYAILATLALFGLIGLIIWAFTSYEKPRLNTADDHKNTDDYYEE